MLRRNETTSFGCGNSGGLSEIKTAGLIIPQQDIPENEKDWLKSLHAYCGESSQKEIIASCDSYIDKSRMISDFNNICVGKQ